MTLLEAYEQGDEPTNYVEIPIDAYKHSDIYPNAPYDHWFTREESCFKYYRLQVHFTLEIEQHNNLAMAVFAFIMACIILSTITFVFESVPEFEDWEGFIYSEWTFSMIFSIEMFLRLTACKNALFFWRKDWYFRTDIMNVVDLCAVVPFYIELASPNTEGTWLRSIRLIRLFRLFRLRKVKNVALGMDTMTRALRKSTRESCSLIVMLLMLELFLCASLIYVWERGDKRKKNVEGHPKCDGQPQDDCVYMRQNPFSLQYEVSPFKSIPEAFWFVMVTLSTVGYGDMVPFHWMGKVVGTFTIMSGVTIFAIILSIIANDMQHSHDDALVMQELRERSAFARTDSGPTGLNALTAGGDWWDKKHSIADIVNAAVRQKSSSDFGVQPVVTPREMRRPPEAGSSQPSKPAFMPELNTNTTGFNNPVDSTPRSFKDLEDLPIDLNSRVLDYPTPPSEDRLKAEAARKTRSRKNLMGQADGEDDHTDDPPPADLSAPLATPGSDRPQQVQHVSPLRKPQPGPTILHEYDEGGKRMAVVLMPKEQYKQAFVSEFFT